MVIDGLEKIHLWGWLATSHLDLSWTAAKSMWPSWVNETLIMGGTAAFVLKTKRAGSPEQQTLGPARVGGGQGVTRKREILESSSLFRLPEDSEQSTMMVFVSVVQCSCNVHNILQSLAISPFSLHDVFRVFVGHSCPKPTDFGCLMGKIIELNGGLSIVTLDFRRVICLYTIE